MKPMQVHSILNIQGAVYYITLDAHVMFGLAGTKVSWELKEIMQPSCTLPLDKQINNINPTTNNMSANVASYQ